MRSVIGKKTARMRGTAGWAPMIRARLVPEALELRLLAVEGLDGPDVQPLVTALCDPTRRRFSREACFTSREKQQREEGDP